jgi:hypothetical protein
VLRRFAYIAPGVVFLLGCGNPLKGVVERSFLRLFLRRILNSGRARSPRFATPATTGTTTHLGEGWRGQSRYDDRDNKDSHHVSPTLRNGIAPHLENRRKIGLIADQLTTDR